MLSGDSVDLANSRIAVVRSLTVVDYHDVRFTQPKTAKGRPSVALVAATLDAMQSHGAYQLEERLRWGEVWTDTGLAFTREDGSAIHPERLTS